MTTASTSNYSGRFPEHLPSRQGAAGRLGARENLLIRLIVYQTAGASFCRDGGGGSLGLAVPFSPGLRDMPAGKLKSCPESRSC